MATPRKTGDLHQNMRQFHNRETPESKEENEIDKLLRSITSLGSDVLEASAAVFHYLETKSIDDEMSVSGRSRQVLHMIKTESEKGNTKPAYKFLETAKAVSEILQEEEEDGDDKSQSAVSSTISAQSPAVFHLLKEDDQHSVSEQSAAIFKILEDARSVEGGEAAPGIPRTYVSRDPPGDGTHITNQECHDCFVKEWCLPMSPKSQETLKIVGAGLNTGVPRKDKYADRYLPDIPEVKSTADETEVLSQEEEPNDLVGSDSVKRGRSLVAFSTFDRHKVQDPPVIRGMWSNQENSVDLTDLPHLHELDADMDFEFVENFDYAYNEFMAAYPRLLERNPELAHNLRIYKLQKLLVHNDLLERSLQNKLEELQEDKLRMEETMQLQLRDAARKKAARQTFLQSELNNLGWSTKRLEAQLRWKFLEYSKDRAKRQFQLRQQFKSIPRATTRSEIIRMIPEGADGRLLRAATDGVQHANGSLPHMLSSIQEDQLRKLQVANSLMSAEVARLSHRLVALQMEAKKYTWVESILVKLDEATLFKLKQKFQTKEGLPRL